MNKVGSYLSEISNTGNISFDKICTCLGDNSLIKDMYNRGDLNTIISLYNHIDRIEKLYIGNERKISHEVFVFVNSLIFMEEKFGNGFIPFINVTVEKGVIYFCTPSADYSYYINLNQLFRNNQDLSNEDISMFVNDLMSFVTYINNLEGDVFSVDIYPMSDDKFSNFYLEDKRYCYMGWSKHFFGKYIVGILL